jgi:hypothetical protein
LAITALVPFRFTPCLVWENPLGRLWIAPVKALVGALVDGARRWVVRVALAKRDEVPDEAAVWVLSQLKDKAEWRRGCSLPSGRHIELHASGESRPALVVLRLALFKVKSRFSAFDFSAGTFRLDSCR